MRECKKKKMLGTGAPRRTRMHSKRSRLTRKPSWVGEPHDTGEKVEGTTPKITAEGGVGGGVSYLGKVEGIAGRGYHKERSKKKRETKK